MLPARPCPTPLFEAFDRMVYWRFVPLVTALLLLLAGLLAFRAAWHLAALWRPPDLPAPVQAVPGRPAAIDHDVDTLLAVPLFGEAPANTESAPVAETVRPSTLRIRLLGVLAGTDARGVAILRHGGRAHVYRVGERLDLREPVTLNRVEPDHVVIERRGARERIELEGGDRRGDAGLRRAEAGEQPESTELPDSISLRDAAFSELVGDLRETLRQNPLRLMRFFSLSPRSGHEDAAGVELNPGQDRRLFSRLGLLPGDVLLSVDGHSPDTYALNHLVDSLETSDSVEVELLRDGQQQTIKLEL